MANSLHVVFLECCCCQCLSLSLCHCVLWQNCLTWILPLSFLLCTCRTDLTDATNRVSALQRQLRDLQGSRQNRLTLFGSWQPDLHQRIEQAARRGRFHHAPVGPIGMESLSCSARVLQRCRSKSPTSCKYLSVPEATNRETLPAF